MTDRFLGDAFGLFSWPFWSMYCSAVWRSAADTHKQLDHTVSGASFLTGGVFECDIVHRRSVADSVCCIRSGVTPMHPLQGALPGMYVLVWVICGTLVAHWHTYSILRCRTSLHRKTFIPLSVSP